MPCLRAQVLPQDSLALVAFYNSTGGSNWTNHSGWLTGPVNTWYGVTVEENRVAELKFYSDNNLNGTIPEEIGSLYELKTLVISNNPNLTGALPGAIGQLINLHGLGIGNYSITGTIPNIIGNCSRLEFLNLPENNLAGSIPPEIGNLDSLLILDLHSNQLTGSIPAEIGNCTKLQELWLNDNKLTGTIPSALANCNQILLLDLSDNHLSGDIPNELATVTSYSSLFFNNNNFTGIPPWDNNWMLDALWIQSNSMTFEDIEPHFVGYTWFEYCPQDSMQTRIDTLLTIGSSFNIYSGTLGQYTTYSWKLNGQAIPGCDDADTLKLTNISYANTGTYVCYAQNSLCVTPSGMPMVLVRRPAHIGISPVGVEELQGISTVNIYPNPCRDILTIGTSLPVNSGTLILTDLQGRLLMQQPWLQNTTKATFDLKSTAPGMYLIRLIADKRQVAETKLVVVK